MNKAQAILYLFPEAKPMVDFAVQDDSDGNGPYIAAWNLPQPQPTESELLAAWEAYLIAEANKPPAPPTDAERIATLEAEKAALAQQVAQQNADVNAFIDFYFSQNPDQA